MEKTFSSYREALAYYQEFKDTVPDGMVMGITTDGHTVRVSKIGGDFELNRTERPKGNRSAHCISDNLGDGVKGVFNHADGKRYDSKSQFERAVKAKGCRIVGNDYNGKEFKRRLEGNFDSKPQLKEAIQKVMGT